MSGEQIAHHPAEHVLVHVGHECCGFRCPGGEAFVQQRRDVVVLLGQAFQ